MRSQKRLRDELRSVTEFNILCDVMQQVAVSQLRRAQEQLGAQPSLSEVLARDFFPLLPPAAQDEPLVHGGGGDRLIVVVTSDEGLVGPLHANVIRQALAHAQGATQWIAIGQRGLRLLGEQAVRPRFMPLPADEELEPKVHRLSQLLLEQFTREALRDVWVVAPHFRSAMRQEVVARQLLPLALRRSSAASVVADLVIEPSVGAVVQALAGLWIEAVCVEALRSARLAELAARAIQMESSRQELSRQGQRLRYACFKSMHERMDVMVRETCVVQHLAAARAGRR